MSTVTRKVNSDIEFVEGEIQRSNKTPDWQRCEKLLGVISDAYYWLNSEVTAETWDHESCEVIIALLQRALLLANVLETAICAPQLHVNRELQGLAQFRDATQKLAALREKLLRQFEENEETEWAKIEKNAPSNKDLLESAKRLRAPQEWYDERPDTSPPVDLQASGKAAHKEGVDNLRPSE